GRGDDLLDAVGDSRESSAAAVARGIGDGAVGAGGPVPGAERDCALEGPVHVLVRLSVYAIVSVGRDQARGRRRDGAERGPRGPVVKRVIAGEVGVGGGDRDAKQRATVHVSDVINLARWHCK